MSTKVVRVKVDQDKPTVSTNLPADTKYQLDQPVTVTCTFWMVASRLGLKPAAHWKTCRP